MTELEQMVHVRYIVDDVGAAIDFYTEHLGFEVRTNAAPAFADVTRGALRLLLSGPLSSAGRAMPDGAVPVPGGWNRVHLLVPDITAEVERLREAGVRFRNDVVVGPGGSQILIEDRDSDLHPLVRVVGVGVPIGHDHPAVAIGLQQRHEAERFKAGAPQIGIDPDRGDLAGG